MARISGVQIPTEKRVEIALTYIFGVGPATSQKILASANIDPNTRVKDLDNSQLDKIREIIDQNYKVEGILRQDISGHVKRLKEIGSYRGERHSKKLPVRGQRTRTNARTKRGRRATVATSKRAPTKT
ncbi:30S ribosomal protein S13 [Patescibacteria group bacterium]|nr:30S ribosomal protein S13 [Patescibacteria group bacterium]